MSDNRLEQLSSLNEIQRFQLELLRRVRYYWLDGERVVNDLLEWRELWFSVIASNPSILFIGDEGPQTEFMLLRATRYEQWPVDTVYIWTRIEHSPLLRQRIEERWEASEIDEYTPEDKGMYLASIRDPHDRVLCIWWD